MDLVAARSLPFAFTTAVKSGSGPFGPGAPTIDDLWRGTIVSVTSLGGDLRVELSAAVD